VGFEGSDQERLQVREALQAVDTETLKAVAAELGYGWRSLFSYRQGERPIPELRLRPLARALGVR
jgi:hypothetical protein